MSDGEEFLSDETFLLASGAEWWGSSGGQRNGWWKLQHFLGLDARSAAAELRHPKKHVPVEVQAERARIVQIAREMSDHLRSKPSNDPVATLYELIRRIEETKE